MIDVNVHIKARAWSVGLHELTGDATQTAAERDDVVCRITGPHGDALKIFGGLADLESLAAQLGNLCAELRLTRTGQNAVVTETVAGVAESVTVVDPNVTVASLTTGEHAALLGEEE